MNPRDLSIIVGQAQIEKDGASAEAWRFLDVLSALRTEREKAVFVDKMMNELVLTVAAKFGHKPKA